MSSRIKLKPKTIVMPGSREEVEQLVRYITEQKALERKLKAELDSKLTEIRKRYEGQIGDLSDQVTPCVESLQAWAEANQAEFCGKKSLALLSGTIGWRTTPPSVKPAKGFTWPAVLERIKELGRMEFVRTKEEVNKEALISARDTDDLKALHVRVEQVDEFFVEPLLTKTTGREVSAE